MYKSIRALVVALPFAMPAMAEDYIVYQDGACFVDNSILATGEDLKRNTQFSMNGACATFELFAFVYDPNGIGNLSDLEAAVDSGDAVLVPRSTQFDWTQCDKSNVLTQSKIEDYVYPLLGGSLTGVITFRGVCINSGGFETGYDERVWEVEIPN